MTTGTPDTFVFRSETAAQSLDAEVQNDTVRPGAAPHNHLGNAAGGLMDAACAGAIVIASAAEIQAAFDRGYLDPVMVADPGALDGLF